MQSGESRLIRREFDPAEIAGGDRAVCDPSALRTHPFASNAISGGSLRGWVIAALALGPFWFAAPAMAGCNSGSVAETDLLSSANCQAFAAGSSDTAVGFGAFAVGTGGTAFGRSAFATGDNSTAVGLASGPSADVAGSTAIGANAGQTGGIYSTAIGAGDTAASAPTANGNYSLAIGGGNSVGGIIGAKATGDFSMAIGTGATASNLSTTA